MRPNTLCARRPAVVRARALGSWRGRTPTGHREVPELGMRPSRDLEHAMRPTAVDHRVGTARALNREVARERELAARSVQDVVAHARRDVDRVTTGTLGAVATWSRTVAIRSGYRFAKRAAVTGARLVSRRGHVDNRGERVAQFFPHHLEQFQRVAREGEPEHRRRCCRRECAPCPPSRHMPTFSATR